MKKLTFLAMMALAATATPALAYTYQWNADFNGPGLDPSLIAYNGATPGQNPAYSYSVGGGNLVMTGNNVPGGLQEIYTKFGLVGDFSAKVTLQTSDVIPANVAGVLQAVHTQFGGSGSIAFPNRWIASEVSEPIDFFTGTYGCTWNAAGAGPNCQFPPAPNFGQKWGNAPVTLTLERSGDTLSASYNFVGSDIVYQSGSYTDPIFAKPAFMDLAGLTLDPGSTITFSDYSISYNQAVPEPGVMLIFLSGLGLLALAMRRRTHA